MIPAFIKSILYLSLMIGTIFFTDIVVLLFICIMIMVLEVLTAIMNKCNNFSLFTILASIFIIVSYLLNVS